jgi:hypothetical protein
MNLHVIVDHHLPTIKPIPGNVDDYLLQVSMLLYYCGYAVKISGVQILSFCVLHVQRLPLMLALRAQRDCCRDLEEL